MHLRIRAIAVLAPVLTLAGAGVASASWHWDRAYHDGGYTGHASGKTCSSSRFSDWHWKGTAHSNGDTYHFKWIEPIRSDGHYRHLHYTSVRSHAFDGYSGDERRTIVAAIKQQLDRSKVAWFDNGPREYLEYKLPQRDPDPVHWTPSHGGC